MGRVILSTAIALKHKIGLQVTLCFLAEAPR